MAATAATIINNGSVVGGAGGTGGIGGTGLTGSGSGGSGSAGSGGAGGAGIIGTNLTVTNSGSITGGKANGGSGAQADAIDFTGGANFLNLSTGTLSGNVGVDGTTTTLDFDQSVSATLTNVITGTGSVIDSGSGTLTLSGANTYAGGTTVRAGQLDVGNAKALGATTNALAVSGGTLDLGAFTVAQNGGLTLTGGSIQDGTLSSSGGFNLQNGTVAAVLDGSGAAVKSTTGTVVMSGANTYTGGTELAGGTVAVSADDNLGAAAGGLTFTGGTLATTASFTTARTVALTGTGTFDPASGTTLTESGVVSGSGALTQAGNGTLVLSGANTYSGGTTLEAGTLDLDAATTLSSTGAVTSGAAGTGVITFGTGDTATLQIEQAALTSTGAGTARFANTVAGFATGDTMDVRGVGTTVASFNYSTDVLTLTGATTTTLQLSGNYAGEVFTATPDGSTTSAGSDVTLTNVSQPAPTIMLASDTGTSNTDGITSDPTVTGHDDIGAMVTIRDASGNTLDSFTATTATYSFTPTTLAQGSNTLTISETRAGETGSASLTFTLDTTAPVAPSTPADTSVMNSSVNAANDTAGQTITGTAEAGSTVKVYDGGTLVDTTTANATTGAWSDQVGMLANGSSHSYTATATDAAGNTSAMSGALAFTVDTTRPTITAVADSGTGIDANGNGDLDAGHVVTLTVSTSEPVYVIPGSGGGTPTLTLSDGATATYTGPTNAATSTLTFSYTVAAGQNAAKLAVSSVNANGATVTDAAGNPISTSLAGATVPSGTLEIDTTAPTASSPTLTVAQNAPATPIGIAAPSDNLTAAGSLAIVADSLPTDGAVTLANGTAVTSGETLTAPQLTGLEFTPTAGVSNQGSTFSYTVTDGAGNATTGTAALNVGSPGAPTITGTHATATTSEAPVTPFSGVTVADPSAATDMLTIALTGAGGMLSGVGLTANANGTYSLTGSAGTVTTELDALSFTPTAGAAGTTSTTTFVLTDASASGTSVTDAGTSVADTDPAATPTPVQPTPTPTPAAADAVSIDQAVTYSHGVFTLTGTASSAAGVSSVEISALVNGTREDLGPATVNANGTFTFSDAIGANQQGFLVATVTDNAGGQATSTDPLFSLTGGLGPRGGTGRQTTYSDGGSTESTVSLFRPNGSRSTRVEAPGQTVDLQPYDIVANHHQAGTSFVYTPGAETSVIDVIRGFKLGGADHDTIALPSSDFRNFADVLRNTGDVNGSAFITDPKTGDAIRLAGVTTAELKSHPKDFTFHG